MSTRARHTVALRREAILSAAVALMSRVGLAELRVADVAAQMGVSAALIFYHFGSKDALVAEAFEHAFARDLDDLEAAVRHGDPLVRLRYMSRLFDGPDAPLGWQLWIDACAIASRQPRIIEVMQRIDGRYSDVLRTVIEDGVAAGRFVCQDPAASVERILALNDGLSTAVMVFGRVTPTQLQDWILAQIAFETGLDVEVLRGS